MKKTIAELQQSHQKKILISMIVVYCVFWLGLIAASIYFQIEPGYSVVVIFLASLLFFYKEENSGYFWFQKEERACMLAARIIANELVLQFPNQACETVNLERFITNSTKLMLYCNKHLDANAKNSVPLIFPSNPKHIRKFVLESFLFSEFFVQSNSYKPLVPYVVNALSFLHDYKSHGSGEYQHFRSSFLDRYRYVTGDLPDHANG